MNKVVLFTDVDPLSTGESNYAWHPLSVLAVGQSFAPADSMSMSSTAKSIATGRSICAQPPPTRYSWASPA
jgi:hypothetical protein